LTKNKSLAIAPRVAITDLLLLAIFFVVTVIIVNPLGSFPLNDDWAYGLTVKHFLATGDFRPSQWASMTLLSNVLWGALFCLPKGYSLLALRVSTLVASLAGILGAYLLVRDVGQSRRAALLAGLLLGLNPIYYALSFTFMTDIPFATLMIFSALFFSRHLRHGVDNTLVLATVLSMVGILSRQIAIALPLGFAITLIMTRGCSRQTIARAVLPAVFCLGTLLLFQHWLSASGRLPDNYNKQVNGLLQALLSPGSLLAGVATHVYVGLCYLGLFLLPLLLWVAPALFRADAANGKDARTVAALAIALPAGVMGAVAWTQGLTMPLAPNIIERTGIGPTTMRYVSGRTELPADFWVAVSVLSLLGAGLLLAFLLLHARHFFSTFRFGRAETGARSAALFYFSSTVVYCLPLIVAGGYARYLVCTVPLLVAGMLALVPTRRVVVPQLFVVLLLVGYAVFTLATTHDYLAWNRTRWQALQELMDKDHVSPADIDGGFEFNGQYLFDPDTRLPAGKDWWWKGNDGADYRASFGPIPGYSVYRDYAYSNWLPAFTGHIVILQNIKGDDPSPPH